MGRLRLALIHLQTRKPALVSFFVPIFEALIAGYITATLVYMAMLLLITRLGRKVLMDGDCVSNTYTVLLCATWFMVALGGAYICCGMSPFAPYGSIGLPVLLALGMGAVVYRNMQQLTSQQSLSATVGVYLTIVAGTVGGLYLRHAV